MQTREVTTPEQDVQQPGAFEVVQKRFTHADIERAGRALIGNQAMFGRTGRRPRMAALAAVDLVQQFVASSAKVV